MRRFERTKNVGRGNATQALGEAHDANTLAEYFAGLADSARPELLPITLVQEHRAGFRQQKSLMFSQHFGGTQSRFRQVDSKQNRQNVAAPWVGPRRIALDDFVGRRDIRFGEHATDPKPGQRRAKIARRRIAYGHPNVAARSVDRCADVADETDGKAEFEADQSSACHYRKRCRQITPVLEPDYGEDIVHRKSGANLGADSERQRSLITTRTRWPTRRRSSGLFKAITHSTTRMSRRASGSSLAERRGPIQPEQLCTVPLQVGASSRSS